MVRTVYPTRDGWFPARSDRCGLSTLFDPKKRPSHPPPSHQINTLNEIFGPSDGPYVTHLNGEAGAWDVWWESPYKPVARFDREDDAKAEMRRLGELWRRTAGRKVYFIGTDSRVGSHVKIGIAYEPHKRLKALQTAHPRALFVLGTMLGERADEQRLHRRFSRVRLEGEWFRVTPALKQMIDQCAKTARST